MSVYRIEGPGGVAVEARSLDEAVRLMRRAQAWRVQPWGWYDRTWWTAPSLRPPNDKFTGVSY